MKFGKIAAIIVGFFLMFCNRVLPPIMGLSPVGMTVLCIFIGTLILLTAVDLVWPVLACVLAFTLNGVYSLNTALQMSFGHNVFWFVAFVSIMLHVLKETGVLWRISVKLFKIKLIGTHPWIFLGCMFYGIVLLGCFLEPATLTLIFIALFSNVFEQLDIRKGDRMAELIILGVMLFAGMSYGVTPLAHPVAMVAVSTFAPLYNVGMVEYTLVGLALAATVVAVYILTLRYVFKMDITPLQRFDASKMQDYGPMRTEEKFVSAVYILVILLWLCPTLLTELAPGLASFLGGLGTAGPAMLGLCLLSAARVDGKPILDVGELISTAVPWKACFPVAASMMLGTALTSEEVGMAAAFTNALEPILRGVPISVFMLILALFCSFFTDFTSNAITAMIASTICVVFIQTGIFPDLHPGAMAIVLGFCSNLAFMYPAGSTYAAIVYGCGWVRPKEQIKVGALYSLLPALLACTVGYGIATLILR